MADFGLAEDIYSSGYFRQDKSGGSVKLPFKWMALESLQEGVFSQKSDVVRKLLALLCVHMQKENVYIVTKKYKDLRYKGVDLK